jgi:hypothetical protein
MIGSHGDIEEGIGPASMGITYAAIFDIPGGNAMMCEVFSQAGHEGIAIGCAPEASMDNYCDRVRTWSRRQV